MPKVPVFYSFHFKNDVFRVQQIRNMGVIEGNPPVSANEWETVKRKGNLAVERWIDDNMKYRRCVVVLIGAETAYRPWVKHEIAKAWNERRGLLGIYVHNLKCPVAGTCSKGPNPFGNWNIGQQSMASLVRCYEPNSFDAYGEIQRNLPYWVDAAISEARFR